MKFIKLLLSITFSLTTFSVAADDAHHHNSKINLHNSIKIICIGDSITQGGKLGRPEYTYRLPLYNLALENNVLIDFVGTRQHGLNKDFKWPIHFDRDHEGYYGKNSVYIRNQITKNLKRVEAPDIAIIHIGTNDKDSLSLQSIVKPTLEIINELRKKNPNVKILIIQIPGKMKYVFTHIWVWVVSIISSTYQSPIYTVDLFSNWDSETYTFDGAHPNVSGQKFIAERILNKLRDIEDTF